MDADETNGQDLELKQRDEVCILGCCERKEESTERKAGQFERNSGSNERNGGCIERKTALIERTCNKYKNTYREIQTSYISIAQNEAHRATSTLLTAPLRLQATKKELKRKEKI
ncbi:hypothetical protein ABE65_018535 [Fictibacillus phosphorivorans]|uniref:Uncharacterized protein n=1 Tax=Fictibacillus phosphorivorans TaxID=1221500 RepID=A0A160IQZ0_9BACL|nr:hypothetical protein [Fictibacillus phosphorivorans]ANC78686.1 hypothetical protein ABE65_018535 [Fictibacillus phosphorivorans]